MPIRIQIRQNDAGPTGPGYLRYPIRLIKFFFSSDVNCSSADDKTRVNVIVDTPLSDFVIAPTISSAADDIKPAIQVKNELPVPLRPSAASGDNPLNSEDCCTDSQKNGSRSAVRAKEDFAAVLRHQMGQLEVPADKLVSAEARSLLLSLAREHLAPVGTGLETLVSQFLAANPCDNTNELLMLVSEGDTRLDSLAGALILEAGGGGGLNKKAMDVVEGARKVFISCSLKKMSLGAYLYRKISKTTKYLSTVPVPMYLNYMGSLDLAPDPGGQNDQQKRK
jgi:hypothetical protein